MTTIPRIISVDDHVVEPPTLWSDRLPPQFVGRGPRIVRGKAKFSFLGGHFQAERGVSDGDWCDWWLYDDLEYPFPCLSAAVGFDGVANLPTTFDEIRPGAWKQKQRLEDMDANHVLDAMGSMLDFLISGIFDRFPSMKVAYSEGQVGWMPFVLERFGIRR